MEVKGEFFRRGDEVVLLRHKILKAKFAAMNYFFPSGTIFGFSCSYGSGVIEIHVRKYEYMDRPLYYYANEEDFRKV